MGEDSRAVFLFLAEDRLAKLSVMRKQIPSNGGASLQGAVAQSNLGVMYQSGQGVPQDHAEAVKWYRLAAEQGDAKAQFGLGAMYADGWGVPQDYVEAHMWFNLAAAQGDARVREARERVEQRMTPDLIAEARQRAREWMAQHH